MKDFRPELHGNPPWSLCVKAQRRPALRANEENCRRSAVNEGGTAELFGPFLGSAKIGVFICRDSASETIIRRGSPACQ